MRTLKTLLSTGFVAALASTSMAGGGCDHSLDLVDSFGDGWDGASIDLLVNAALIIDDATILDPPGDAASFIFTANDGDMIDTVYTSGSFENEHTYSISSSIGGVLGSDGPSPGAGISVVGSCAPPTCDHTLDLVDTFGDGWDGASIDVLVDAALVIDDATILDPPGDAAQFTFAASTGSAIDTVYTSGSFENEHIYTILDGTGNVLGTDGPFPGAGISVVGDCDSPPPPPANDDCANATSVGFGTFAFDINTATTDGLVLDPMVCDMGPAGDEQIHNDIWYCFTAPESDDVEVTTFGIAGFDTRLAVYDNGCASPDDPAAVIACNDDFAGFPFEAGLTFTAVAGTQYKIRLGGFSATTFGAGDLLIQDANPPVPPANDDCANAAVINEGLTAFDLTLATTDGLELDAMVCDMGPSGTEQINNDVWYCFTAPADKDYYVSTLDLAGFDTRLAVYDNGCAAPDDPAAVIACNDDELVPAAPPFEAGLTFSASAGTSYKIRLGTFSPFTTPQPAELLLEEVANFESLCFGDGTGAACPCGNTGNVAGGGCLNSNGTAAVITTNGATSVAGNTLQFDMTGGTSSTFGVLVSGDNALGGGLGIIGLPVKDGLRCVGGNAQRHGTRALDAAGANLDSWGSLTGPPGGIIGGAGFTAGQSRYFQVRYREDPMAGPCGSDQNTSNAIRISFKP